jgi:hypothetical protein
MYFDTFLSQGTQNIIHSLRTLAFVIDQWGPVGPIVIQSGTAHKAVWAINLNLFVLFVCETFQCHGNKTWTRQNNKLVLLLYSPHKRIIRCIITFSGTNDIWTLSFWSQIMFWSKPLIRQSMWKTCYYWRIEHSPFIIRWYSEAHLFEILSHKWAPAWNIPVTGVFTLLVLKQSTIRELKYCNFTVL